MKNETKTLEPGDVYRNHNPYKGEGNIIITDKFDKYGNVLVIHCEHKKYPGLNGITEWKDIDAVIMYYVKLA